MKDNECDRFRLVGALDVVKRNLGGRALGILVTLELAGACGSSSNLDDAFYAGDGMQEGVEQAESSSGQAGRTDSLAQQSEPELPQTGSGMEDRSNIDERASLATDTRLESADNPSSEPASMAMAGNRDEPAAESSPERDARSQGDCLFSDLNVAPLGYGAATTGGGTSTPIVVNSFEEASAALVAYRAAFKAGTADSLVIRYAGQFDYGQIDNVCDQHNKPAARLQIKEMDNVTFEGLSGSSANFGLHVNRAKNVIIRNMTLGLLPGGGDSDAITIEGNGTNGDVENVWIDHNELFSSTRSDCAGAGDTEFDGLIDIKKGARRITISYNHLHDHQKTGLIGFSDSDDTERYITFHHNWYQDVVSRTPLQRFGFVHLFNNYYNRVSGSGINVRMGGVALIEANYFEHVANPVTSRYSDEVGFWDLRDNFVGEGVTWSSGSDTLANAEQWQSTIEYPAAALDYEYRADVAMCVKQRVMATAGATL